MVYVFHNNIPFFLYHGTALGAHREKKFIEHDLDIDIGVLENNFCVKKIHQTLNKYKSNFKLTANFPKDGNLSISEVTYTHIKTGVKIDIFKIIKTKEGYIHYTYTDLCDNKKNKRCEYINKFEFEDINFLGKKYRIPNKLFLISNYGNDWDIVKKYSYEQGVQGEYKSMQN